MLLVYGQAASHDDAVLMGSRRALRELRDTLNAVLEDGKPRAIEVFCADGEGYDLGVALLDRTMSHSDWQRLAPPYASVFGEGQPQGEDPVAVIPGLRAALEAASQLRSRFPGLCSSDGLG